MNIDQGNILLFCLLWSLEGASFEGLISSSFSTPTKLEDLKIGDLVGTSDNSLEGHDISTATLQTDLVCVREREGHIYSVVFGLASGSSLQGKEKQWCGWGTLAIEVVKRTGCKYTGITLLEQQLHYAELKVKEAGLQDSIQFVLCDYRQLPNTGKYDRIITCEMLEAVGHEFMEEFFRCCESVLADDGLLVLQFISVPDERYDEYRQSSDFIKEYIFPGGCLPSLSRVTSAMAAVSRLWLWDSTASSSGHGNIILNIVPLALKLVLLETIRLCSVDPEMWGIWRSLQRCAFGLLTASFIRQMYLMQLLDSYYLDFICI